MSVPILFLFIALELGEEEGTAAGLVLELLLNDLGIGLVAGLGVAALGGWLLRTCWRHGWVSQTWIQITTVALAFACFSVADSLGGSGYISAFTGGLLFGVMAKEKTEHLVEPAEGIGVRAERGVSFYEPV